MKKLEFTTELRKTIMTKAHLITKANVASNKGNYRIALSIALKEIYALCKKRYEFVASTGHLCTELYYFANRIIKSLEEAKEKASGIIEIHYSEYKRNTDCYCKVENSYDAKKKTIKVVVLKKTVDLTYVKSIERQGVSDFNTSDF